MSTFRGRFSSRSSVMLAAHSLWQSLAEEEKCSAGTDEQASADDQDPVQLTPSLVQNPFGRDGIRIQIRGVAKELTTQLRGDMMAKAKLSKECDRESNTADGKNGSLGGWQIPHT